MPTPGKLGKLAPRIDARTLKFRRYRTGGLPTPLVSRAWDKGIRQWGLMLNDTLGCCVCAAMGHAEQLVTLNASTEVTVPDSAVLTAYEQVGGYVPNNPATDNGCDMLTALGWWQKTGIAGHTIAAYADCSVSLVDDVKDCIDLLGFCYIGFEVPQSAMDQFSAGQPWTVAANDGGIVGGHCVDLVDYDATGITCITWGQLQRMSWEFFTKYCDEAYGVVTQEWIAANGQSPSGFALSALLADVQLLTQEPAPQPRAVVLTAVVGTSPVVSGQPCRINVTVMPSDGQSPGPTGTITIPSLPPALLTQGAATLTLTPVATGTLTLSIAYSGDANFAAASISLSVTVNAAPNPQPDPVSQFWAQIGPYAAAVFAAKDVTGLAMVGQLCSSWAVYIRSQSQQPALPALPPMPPPGPVVARLVRDLVQSAR